MLVLLLLGAQGAWADLKKSAMGNDVCSPKIHFKLPSGWTTAYMMIGGIAVPFPDADANGWSTIDLGTTKTNDDQYFFINGVEKNDCNDGKCLTSNGVNVTSQNARVEGFTCTSLSSISESTPPEVWIMEHPDPHKEGQLYMKGTKPVIRDFYVFLPNNKDWKSATPLSYEDGKDHEMLVSDACGWYYRRFIDEDLPAKVLIHRDDDEYPFQQAIGTNGEWDDNPTDPEPISLSGAFLIFEPEEGFNDALYFVADLEKATELGNDGMKGWYVKRPDIQANCTYDLAAVIYDTDASLHPLFSCYKEGSQGFDEACQEGAQDVSKAAALAAIEACVGVKTGLVESTLDPSTKKLKLTEKGKECFISEKYFDQLFNYTPGVNEMSCYDMTFSQSPDGKWEFDSDNYTSRDLKVDIVGGFYPVEGTTNEIIIAADPNQTPVPAARTKRWAQGPVYYGPELRKNDPTEQMPIIDVFCKGPGWDGGFKCDGLFADGTKTEEAVRANLKLAENTCVFGWSCDNPGNAPKDWQFYKPTSETKVADPTSVQGATLRWDSREDGTGNKGCNQHFCFKSRANFRFKHGLKFNFRGDDDIWIYIDNKLAVDLGGTHLAAPGYVDLDKFMPNATVGDYYDVDIFFCDRRTTMSNVRIKTNMFIEQTQDIVIKGNIDGADLVATGNNTQRVCYTESGEGSCASINDVNNGAKTFCGDSLTDAVDKGIVKASFLFTKGDKTGTDPESIILSEADFAASKIQFNGGINVTKAGNPIFNKKILESYLQGGDYYLITKIGTKISSIYIRINGTVGVANREAVTVDDKGNYSLPYEYKNRAMGFVQQKDGTMDLNQFIPLYIAELTDPCGSTASCTKPLEMRNSKGSEYTLTANPAKALFYKMIDGKMTRIDPSEKRAIGDAGLDTVYVTVPMDELLTSRTESVSVYVTGTTRKAELTFFAPMLVYVESDSSSKVISQDPDSLIRMKASTYDFYLMALNPDTTFCSDCNFDLERGDETSGGVAINPGDNRIVNGRGKISIVSSRTYLRSTGDTATLSVIGPNGVFTKANYINLQFQDPPVPMPQLADIFDVHGDVSAMTMNVGSDYYSATQHYLDGIGDSIAIYYHRGFKSDSLPDKIVVYWADDEKDTVVFTNSEIKDAIECGVAGKADSCSNVIKLGGKNLSTLMKTGGKGMVKSWQTYCPKYDANSKCVTALVTGEYKADIYDRIAPVIVSARAITDTTKGAYAKLQIKFSELVKKTPEGIANKDEIFSYYINAGQTPRYEESLPMITSISIPDVLSDSSVTLMFDQNGMFPQAGDYIHFRSVDGGEVGFVTDQSVYAEAPGADTLRVPDTYNWNVATGYKETSRLPSPWVLITGDVSAFAERIIDDAVGKPASTAAVANLPVAQVYSYDANKDKSEFAKDIKNGVYKEFDKDYIPHGWFVKSDMGALIDSKEEYSNMDRSKVYFNYEIQIFTNLGAYVASKKGRIYCNDKEYFETGDCVTSRKNFFIAWNMKSDDGRAVGAGAFISKLKTYVQLGNVGKKNKNDKTEMWGVRRGLIKTTSSKE